MHCELNAKCVNGQCVVDECLRVNCLNGGSCIGGTCQCVNNFTGPFCQEDPCVRMKCINGGFCMPPGVCRCLNKFYGQYCEQSPCANVTCLNGGKCLYGECACMPEWSGARCERPSEAARDYKVYSDTIQQLAANVSQIGQRMQMIHNVTAPAFISQQIKDLVKDIQENFMTKARNDSKTDFATPKVLGYAPVTRDNMRMPNTPMENAKIYEDKDLAYQKAREIRDKRLLHVVDTIQKYDAQHVTDAAIIAKDVPGAEYFKGPFGGFAQVTEKYVGVDNSLLEQDLDSYRSERSNWEAFMDN